MIKIHAILLFITSFFFGIIVESFFEDENFINAILIINFFITYLYFSFYFDKKNFLYFIASIFLGFGLGIFRFGVSSYEIDVVKILGESIKFFDWIVNVKTIFEDKLFYIFPEPYGSFVGGIILGSRQSISYDFMQKLNATGLTHIIAISGYNITLLISFVSCLFKFFGRKVNFFLCIVFVILFTILVGMSASVVRASIMGIILCLSVYVGRQYFSYISLFIAAFFMALVSPSILLCDISFQLSFFAAYGIICFSSIIKNNFTFIPENFGLREILSMTISSQIFTLPLIIYYFHRVSVVFIFSNLIVLPLVPFIMFFGFLSVFFGLISNFAGEFFGFICYVLLKIIIFFIDFLASLKFSSFELWNFPWIFVFLYYFLIFNLFSIFRKNSIKF